VDGTNGSWDRSKREGDRWEVCGHALRLHDSGQVESGAFVVGRTARDEPREVIQRITGERISPINKRCHGATMGIHEDAISKLLRFHIGSIPRDTLLTSTMWCRHDYDYSRPLVVLGPDLQLDKEHSSAHVNTSSFYE